MRIARDIVLITAFVGYLLFAWVTVDRRGDEQQVTSLVADTVQAINDRDLGGALRYVSKNYRGGDGLNRERLRMLIAQGLRAETDYHATGRIEDLSIRGETASMSVLAQVDGGAGQSLYRRVLRLDLRREPARHAILFPARVWRVISVDTIGLNESF